MGLQELVRICVSRRARTSVVSKGSRNYLVGGVAETVGPADD